VINPAIVKKLRYFAVFIFAFFWVQGTTIWFFADSLIWLTGCDRGSDYGSRTLHWIIEYDRGTGIPINNFYWGLGYGSESFSRAAGRTIEKISWDLANNCRETGKLLEMVGRESGTRIRQEAIDLGEAVRSSLRDLAFGIFYGMENGLRAVGEGLRNAGYAARDYCYEKGKPMKSFFEKGNKKMTAFRDTMENLKKYLKTQSQSLGTGFRAYVENLMYNLAFEVKSGSIGSTMSGGTLEIEFTDPIDMTTDEFRNIYVLDRASCEIIIISREGKFIKRFGKKGSADGCFEKPSGLFMAEDGRLFVADTGNKRVQIFNRKGDLVGILGSKTDTEEVDFEGPLDVAVMRSGNIVVSDSSNKLFLLDSRGVLIKCIGQKGGAKGEFRNPVSIDCGKLNDTIYVADRENNRVQVLDKDGEVIMMLERTGFGGRLVRPNSVFVHNSGIIFVGDEGRPPLHNFFPNGSYMGGVGRFGKSVNEPWEFYKPRAIAVSLNLTISILDSSLRKVRVFKLSWDPPDDRPDFSILPDFGNCDSRSDDSL
jgi:sugar lactone lactonase YvrE